MYKKLSLKILVPSLFVLFSGLVTVAVIAHNTTENILTESMQNSISFSLDSLISQSNDSKQQVVALKETMSKNYIDITTLLAEYLKDRPEEFTTQNYIDLAQKIGVDEIHVTDENGILRWGSIEEFYGYDFNSADQTIPFIEILKDSSFTLAQEPQLRGADNVLFQYIGVSSVGSPGIVQVGIEANVIQDLLERVDLQNLIDKFKVDEYGGDTFILNNQGVITKHRDKDKIGVDLVSEYSWGSNFLDSDNGSIYYNMDGEDKYLSYKRVDDEIFCACVFITPYITPLHIMDKAITVASIIFALILSWVIIYFLRRFASLPLRSLNKKINILAQGNLTEKIAVKSNDEVGELSQGINNLVSSLKLIVNNIKDVSTETESIKNHLNNQAQESSDVVDKISLSVEDISSEMRSLDKEIQDSVITEQNIEKEIQELDNIIENQVSAVEESTAAVNEMVTSLKNVSLITTNKYKAMEKLVEKTDTGSHKLIHMNHMVLKIQDSLSEIFKTVSIINDIASRTSLLSMNAAIEAAHAGDEGRGFAVVADEIRKLSDSTAKNAELINNVLDNIKIEVNEAAVASGDSTADFSEITTEVKSVSQALSEINMSTDELSHGGEQILDAMLILQEVSFKVKKSALEMSNGARGMGSSMTDVKNISCRVLEKVLGISCNSKLISEGSESISHISHELSNNTMQLDGKIQMFVTE